MRDRIPALPRNNLSWLTSRGVVSYLRGSFFIKKLGRISSETLAVFARHSNRASRWRNRMQLAAVVRRERIFYAFEMISPDNEHHFASRNSSFIPRENPSLLAIA